MKNIVVSILLISILGLSALAFAEESARTGATSGTYMAGPTNQVTLSITRDPIGNVDVVTYTHNGITSPSVKGVPHKNGGTESAPMRGFNLKDNNESNDRYYRIWNGKVQWANNPNSSQWSAMPKKISTAS